MKLFANVTVIISIPFSLASIQTFLLVVFSKYIIQSLSLGPLTPLLLRIFNMKMLQLLSYIARGCFSPTACVVVFSFLALSDGHYACSRALPLLTQHASVPLIFTALALYIQVIKSLLSLRPLFPCFESSSLFQVVQLPLLGSDRVALYKLKFSLR